MASDDIKHMAWSVVAEHMTRGENDPAKMVAAGIQRERDRWTAGGHIDVYVQDNDVTDEERLFDPCRPDRNRRH